VYRRWVAPASAVAPGPADGDRLTVVGRHEPGNFG